MNKGMLYVSDEDGDNKVCKLCGRACGDHFAECPGALIEDLEFQVHAWYDDGRELYKATETAPTIEEAFKLTFDEMSYETQSKATVRLVGPGKDITGAFREYSVDALAKIQAKHRAEKEERDRAIRRHEYHKALAALESDRASYYPAAFKSKLDALQAKYADVVTP